MRRLLSIPYSWVRTLSQLGLIFRDYFYLFSAAGPHACEECCDFVRLPGGKRDFDGFACACTSAWMVEETCARANVFGKTAIVLAGWSVPG